MGTGVNMYNTLDSPICDPVCVTSLTKGNILQLQPLLLPVTLLDSCGRLSGIPFSPFLWYGTFVGEPLGMGTRVSSTSRLRQTVLP